MVDAVTAKRGKRPRRAGCHFIRIEDACGRAKWRQVYGNLVVCEVCQDPPVTCFAVLQGTAKPDIARH